MHSTSHQSAVTLYLSSPVSLPFTVVDSQYPEPFTFEYPLTFSLLILIPISSGLGVLFKGIISTFNAQSIVPSNPITNILLLSSTIDSFRSSPVGVSSEPARSTLADPPPPFSSSKKKVPLKVFEELI